MIKDHNNDLLLIQLLTN